MNDQSQEKAKKEHSARYHFFVDGNKYDVDQSSLTGADIKRIANVNANYQLFLEKDGNDPDEQIADSTGIDLTHGPKHFYAVPPATFGAK